MQVNTLTHILLRLALFLVFFNIIMYSSSMMAIAYYCHTYGGCELQFGSN